MRIFCTGPNGYVGKALVKAGVVFPLCSDVTNLPELQKEIQEKKPDLILHLAAKSNVDWCEKEENTEELIRVNKIGTQNVCSISRDKKIKCVVFSTDQIWGGGWTEPWWTPHKEVGKKTLPVNQYGLSKAVSEFLAEDFGAKVIRTSFLFSSDRDEMEERLGKLKDGFPIIEPTFIKRSFLHRDHFAIMLGNYCNRFEEMPRVLHLSGRATVSWYDFMVEVAKQYGVPKRLVKPRRKENVGFAPRPHNGGLDVSLSKKLGFKTYDYVDGIRRMKSES